MTITIDAVEQARDLLAFPDTDDPAWQLEEVRKLLGIQVGRKPEPISDREIWESGQDVDLMAVARELAKACFQEDSALQKIEFDFLDCGLRPWIMLEMKADGAEDRIPLGDYGGPSGATELLDAIGDDLYASLDGSEGVVFTRAEVLGEVPA